MMPKAFLRRHRAVFAGALAACLSALGLLALPSEWREIATAQAEDALMRLAMVVSTHRAPSPPIIVIDIDQPALAEIGPWPWPREKLAVLVETLAAGKPAALGIDMLLAGPDPRSPVAEIEHRERKLDADTMARLRQAFPDGDARLAEALATTPAILGLVLDPDRPGEAPAAPILAKAGANFSPLWRAAGVLGPHDTLEKASLGLGIIAMPGDADGVIRRLPLFAGAGTGLYPGIAMELLRVSQGASGYLLESNGHLQIGDVSFPLPSGAILRLVPGLWGGQDIRRVAALEVLSRKSSEHRAPIEPGSLVLIGGSAPALGGLRTGQDDALVPAVMIQARGLAQLQAGLAPRAMTKAGTVHLLLAVIASIFSLLAALRLSPVWGLAAMAGGSLGLGAASGALFLWTGVLFAPLLAALCAVSAYGAASVMAFVETRRHAARVRQRFEQHLAPQVVSMIVAEPDLLKLKGERRDITALFTDVEGFTAMTERAEPEMLVRVLDEYFEGLAAILIRHGGMIDKIVGDAIHALFNAPLALPDHQEKAVACALEMARWSAEFRLRAEAATIGFGRTRFGIETGTAIVGDIGIRSKLDYTAHGAVVNLTARLEAANKLFGSTLCLGPAISAALPKDQLRPLGRAHLHGVSDDTLIHEPWPEGSPPEWREGYLAAFGMMEADPKEAASRLRALAAQAGGDMVCLTLAQRLEAPADEAPLQETPKVALR